MCSSLMMLSHLSPSSSWVKSLGFFMLRGLSSVPSETKNARPQEGTFVALVDALVDHREIIDPEHGP